MALLSILLPYEDSFARMVKPEREKKFMEELFREKRYFDVIAQAQRIQFHEQGDSLDYLINLCYFRGGQFLTVIKKVKEISPKHGRYMSLKELQTLSYMNMGEYHAAYRNSLFIKDPFELTLRNRERLFRMRVMPLIKTGKRDILLREISLGEKYLKEWENFSALRQELLEFSNLRFKSPLFASLSSAIIPGAGQVYCKSYMAGVISFLSIASTVMGGLVCHQRGKPGYGNTLLGFSALFYFGNIYGAWNSAERYNASRFSSWEKRINEQWTEREPGRGKTMEELLR